MTHPAAIAVTGLPIAAGRSTPFWNVLVSGRFAGVRGPKGYDTHAGSTGRSSDTSGRFDSAACDVGGTSPRRIAIATVPHHQHFPSILELLPSFVRIRASAKRSGMRAMCIMMCLIRNMSEGDNAWFGSLYRATALLSFRFGGTASGGATSSGLLRAARSASRSCPSFRSFSTFRPKTSFT
jgi:hypothetical protein